MKYMEKSINQGFFGYLKILAKNTINVRKISATHFLKRQLGNRGDRGHLFWGQLT